MSMTRHVGVVLNNINGMCGQQEHNFIFGIRVFIDQHLTWDGDCISNLTTFWSSACFPKNGSHVMLWKGMPTVSVQILLRAQLYTSIMMCVFLEKMHIQIMCRICTGWLREKFMVRKPCVKERKSLFFNGTVYWICCSQKSSSFCL